MEEVPLQINKIFIVKKYKCFEARLLNLELKCKVLLRNAYMINQNGFQNQLKLYENVLNFVLL